ncbi:FG-GAP repeat domain-containing protein [Streptomyces sp. NPDC058872]|uniref:FG-GAP repeat domain-containing protein n=1 Tax=Streptomyces sp. NPDC058872 TaxID=3346661 RepID=UPI003694F777
MRRIARRAATLSAAAGLLTAATLLSPHTASAADEVRLSGYDVVAAPGSFPQLFPTVESWPYVSRVVVAVGTQPMTDPAGAGAGLPSGYEMRANGCREATGYTGVFVCESGGQFPRPNTTVPADADDATLYWGFAYAPGSGDLNLDAAVQEARSAGSRPADGRHGTGKITVKSRAHALLNTIAFDLPTVPDGGTVHQQMRVHANDDGRLILRFARAQGQLTHSAPPIRIGRVSTGSGATCEIRYATLDDGLPNLACELEAGDHVIGYELTSDPGQYAQKFQAHTRYDIYDLAVWDESDVKQTSAPFSVEGSPVVPWHGLRARDTSGKLWDYRGTGNAVGPLDPRHEAGHGWQAYTAITSLSPYEEGPFFWDTVTPSDITRGLGDFVARDAAGTLWYYDRQLGAGVRTAYAPRVRVGGGWNVYDQIAGAGDLNGDALMDLVARDKAGTLWFYAGTGTQTSGARFKARVRIGGGWQVYDRLAGGADLTGDGRADLLARDKAGVLWLYKGTGKAAAPYAPRVRVGGGWQVYDQLVVTGDLTDDGRADAVARDRTGTLWLYRGTGKPTAPFLPRTRIGGGWNTYDHLF